MKTTLPSGQNVQVGVRHTSDLLPNHQKNPTKLDQTMEEASVCRSTHVRLTLEDGTDFEARAVCKPPDQFCKRDGRRRAANRLLQSVKHILTSKEDRRAVFKMVCPEYKSSNSRREKRLRKRQLTKEQ